MPDGTPSAAQLWDGNVTFFSIDTDLIQAAGYKFDEGLLHQLPNLLPQSMELQLTDVVAQEIVRHQMRPVNEAAREFMKCSDTLKRVADINMDAIDHQFAALAVSELAARTFRQRMETYAERCRGGILPIQGDNLTSDVFTRYFSMKAPFESSKEKKSEFPDATSLLMLENYAKGQDTKGVMASKDGGWSDFAKQSEFLYCVKSLDELLTLFEATGALATSVKARVTAAIQDEHSPLREQLHARLRDHVEGATFYLGEIYSGVVPRVDGDIFDATIIGSILQPQNIKVFNRQDDRSTWVIESTISLEVELKVDVTFYVVDGIDRDEVSVGSRTYTRQLEFDVQAFLTCSGVQAESTPDTWDVDIEIAAGAYAVDVGEVEPSFGE
ncbi:PIN domain-containing protein [Pandoraea communis]|uniref:PIN domain-containing protein n=1 Tax=Pandoraea communis TaxID=2508297 RepID=UPI0025A5E2B4|nr:PIN domain-containing protein [Pandoraea communis]MDM8358833.1 PIN domain-containing protein [Pandoraea communis]